MGYGGEIENAIYLITQFFSFISFFQNCIVNVTSAVAREKAYSCNTVKHFCRFNSGGISEKLSVIPQLQQISLLQGQFNKYDYT